MSFYIRKGINHPYFGTTPNNSNKSQSLSSLVNSIIGQLVTNANMCRAVFFPSTWSPCHTNLFLGPDCPMIDFMRLVEAEPFSSVSASHSLQRKHCLDTSHVPSHTPRHESYTESYTGINDCDLLQQSVD